MSHTTGPWTLETVKTQVGVCHKIGPFPGTCGREMGHACIYVDGIHSFPGPHGPKEEELLANARLMTAAPDLLAALQRCLAHFDNIRPVECDESPMAAQARRAIRKATGQ